MAKKVSDTLAKGKNTLVPSDAMVGLILGTYLIESARGRHQSLIDLNYSQSHFSVIKEG